MRTLKKVLALTLALATLFSLTAFAAYKDESKIDPDVLSAVNLVSSLKIMMGDENGFRPTDTIKRSEAAKMVYVLRTGGKTDADGWKGQNLFTDMKGHWAEGYVNYCASVGIIAGVGNKKFNPNGNVTGVELAKMLLVAAGYKADIQGYAGAQWANKVLADAESVGMFDGYNAAYTAAAPRQYAAQMFANTLLRTNMAVYLSGELVTGSIGKEVTVGAKYFGLTTDNGKLTSVGSKTFGITKKDALSETTYSFAGAKAELLYQNVSVVSNSKNGEVYDIFANGTTKVYDTTVGSMAVNSDLIVSLGDVKLDKPAADYDVNMYRTATRGGTGSAIGTANKMKLSEVKALLADASSKVNSDVRVLVEGGKITSIILFNEVYTTVVKNDTVFDVANDVYDINKDNYSKINFKDTVAKGDYVKMYLDMAGTMTVAKAQSFVGMAVSVSDGVYNVGGTKYTLGASKIGSPAITLGTEYKFITDGKYILAVTSATDEVVVNEFSKDICLVLATNFADYDKSTDLNPVTPRVQVLLATGETKIYEWGGTKTELETINENLDSAEKVMQYSLKDGKMLLKAVVDPDGEGENGSAFVTKGTAPFKFTASGKLFQYGTKDKEVIPAVKVSADAFFFMKKDSKHVVVKASELNGNINEVNAIGMAYTVKNGITTLAFGYIPASAPVAASTSTYAIVNGVVGDKWDAKAEKTVKYIPAVDMKGNPIEIVLEKNDDGNVFVDNNATATVTKAVYKVVTNADGMSRLETPKPAANDYAAKVAISGFDASSIVVGGKFVNFAADMTTIFVDETGSDSNPSYKVLTDKSLENNDNVIYVMNGDGDITTLIVLK